MIGDNYLMIHRWKPNFDPFSDKVKILAAWIRIPGLSLDTSMRGSYRAWTTLQADRGQFVRLVVEIDIAMPLLSKFRFRGRSWHCGKIGHLLDACPTLVQDTDACSQVECFHPASSPNDIGAWNKVVKPGRRPQPAPTTSGTGVQNKGKEKANLDHPKEPAQGSRFSALLSVEADTENSPTEPETTTPVD
ncbi:hypothetical protein V2J09_004046 [Rumex salicifolius]